MVNGREHDERDARGDGSAGAGAGDGEPGELVAPPTLDTDTVDRIRCVAQQLQEVHPAAQEEWEVGFLRSRDLERDLASWERLTDTYVWIVETFHVPRRKRQEVWSILLLASMEGGELALAEFPLVLLTEEERDAVVHHFRRYGGRARR
ncbi:MAG: hypothetical protein HY719_15405 [Planctomycetes bacterium]|nr:hypothetical protein [Planctomycetota bacterium]